MTLRNEINKLTLPQKRNLLAKSRNMIRLLESGAGPIAQLRAYALLAGAFPQFKGANLYNLANHANESVRNHERRNLMRPHAKVVRNILSGRRETRGA